MSQHLKFISTHPPYRVSDENRLYLIRGELLKIVQHQNRLHFMDTTPGLSECAEEAYELLTEYLDYVPGDDDMDPTPVTAAEMHTAAWKQHIEMHS
jgi:hypothetical protein